MMINQQQQHQLMNMNQSLMSMNQMNPHQQLPQVIKFNQNNSFNRPSLISRSSNRLIYGPQINWAQSQQFQNPNRNRGSMKPPSSLGPRSNWKGKKVNKANDMKRKPLINIVNNCGINQVSNGGSGVGNLDFKSYNPPTLNELQRQNRVKARKCFPRNKLNSNSNSMDTNMSGNFRSAPYAPRNTTSFIMRAKRGGGIAPSVSPYAATPAVLPTPILSPSSEVLGDMAKEEWGVDGYGSMKGLIRLRSPGNEIEANEDEEEDEGGSSGSDVEEHLEVERRLDHDLSRFVMISDPDSSGSDGVGVVQQNPLANRVDDQNKHIAKLEEENLILEQRLFLMERELGELRERMLCLERSKIDDGVVENVSANSSGSCGGGENDVSLLDVTDKC